MQKEGFKIRLDLKRNLYRPIQKTEDISHRTANFTYDMRRNYILFLIPRPLSHYSSWFLGCFAHVIPARKPVVVRLGSHEHISPRAVRALCRDMQAAQHVQPDPEASCSPHLVPSHRKQSTSSVKTCRAACLSDTQWACI